MKAPGQGVEESNRALLSAVQTVCHGVSKWNAFEAPQPHGTVRVLDKLLATHKFYATEDKGILYSSDAWSWGHPTWFISGVSSEPKRKAFWKWLCLESTDTHSQTCSNQTQQHMFLA